LSPAYLQVLAEIISLTLNMEAICSSETSVATQQTTRRHIPKDCTLLDNMFYIKMVTLDGIAVDLHLIQLIPSGTQIVEEVSPFQTDRSGSVKAHQLSRIMQHGM
jgi:hypothetical protein